MSRATQILSYINSEYEPTAKAMTFDYTHISKTPELKLLRREYLTAIGRFKHTSKK